MRDILRAVYGASGCGRGVMPLLRSRAPSGLKTPQRLVFVDDGVESGKIPRLINGHEVLSYSEFREIEAAEKQVVLAISDGQTRSALAARCESDSIGFFETRAENVIVMDDVVIGEGAILSPFVTLTSNIRIGRHFHANLYSYVEHDCVVGDFVTFAPGVRCNGNVVIEDYVYVGSGAVIKQGRPGEPIVIGRGAVVGMGAVVTRSVRPGDTVVGIPARPVSNPTGHS